MTGLLCDEVRREHNGKLIAIGIYGSRIFVAGFPALLNLSTLLNVVFESSGEQRFKVRVSVNGEMKTEIEIAVESAWGGSDWFPIPCGNIQFDRPSEIKLSADDGNGKWKAFLTIPIEIGPTSPTA